MEIFANLMISFFELIEAEGRTLRQKSVYVVEGFLVMFFGVSMIIYGSFAVGAAVYFWLSPYIGKPMSAFLVSLLFIGAGAWLICKGRSVIHGREGQNVTAEEK